jgi:exopolyphosphatase/guanosine-5'-triphosphate,3'-diphosphate pyrophosphatase
MLRKRKAANRERTVAFIDIGTNSIRLLLARFHPNSTHTILSVQKETVRLGEHEFPDDMLRPAAMERALQVCKQFSSMARANDADEIVAVATSATREARNKDEFIKMLRKQARLTVHTISGLEEARLIYLGVSNAYDLKGKSALFIDIGGGSTELIVGDQQNYKWLDSLKLGAIRLGSLLFAKNETKPIKPKQYRVVRQYVLNTAIRSLQKLNTQKFETAIGSSGTIENLANIAAHMDYGRPRRKEDVLTLEQVNRVIKTLCALPLKERAKLPGVNARRADIIIPGAAILQTVMKEAGVNELQITDLGMQHGLLVDYMLKHGYMQRVEADSFRLENVKRFARKMQADMPHAEKVSQLSLSIFDSGKRAGFHKIDPRYRELLEYAAILHDIGIFLSYSSHEAHSYYLIRNAGLEGFDQEETQIMASLAFFHRKRYPQTKHTEFEALDAESRKVIRQLAIILRLAESLDRSHVGVVTQAALRRRGEEALLEVSCSHNCDLELWGLNAHEKAFEKAFGVAFLAKASIRKQ